MTRSLPQAINTDQDKHQADTLIQTDPFTSDFYNHHTRFIISEKIDSKTRNAIQNKEPVEQKSLEFLISFDPKQEGENNQSIERRIELGRDQCHARKHTTSGALDGKGCTQMAMGTTGQTITTAIIKTSDTSEKNPQANTWNENICKN